LAEEIISEFGEDLETITLVKVMEGRFEVSVNGTQVFSKKEEKRHPQPGEVVERMRATQVAGK